MLTIRLPEDIDARSESLAKRAGRCKAFYARAAILPYLDDLEDLYLAEQLVQRIRRDEERTFTPEARGNAKVKQAGSDVRSNSKSMG